VAAALPALAVCRCAGVPVCRCAGVPVCAHNARVDRDLAGQVVVRFVGCLGEDPHLSASAVKVPLRDHRRTGRLSVFHRPYRSGSSRHTTAVWALNSSKYSVIP
jgi:hypothetical protein